jgi:hypothetical protein
LLARVAVYAAALRPIFAAPRQFIPLDGDIEFSSRCFENTMPSKSVPSPGITAIRYVFITGLSIYGWNHFLFDIPLYLRAFFASTVL